MTIDPRFTLLLLLLGSACATVAPEAPMASAHHAPPRLDAPAALQKLKEGNARFLGLAPPIDHALTLRRSELASAQHPFAIVVGCSDSRTPPELLFDQGLGDLFVIRSAGNLVDDFALGSLEYAIEHLGARLVVVLGHERCGAVAAAWAGGRAPGHVHDLVREIRPAVEAARGLAGNALENAVRANVERVAKRIRGRARFGDLASEVRVVRAYYDLDSGEVEFVDGFL
jgi:carbonic anhydrase